MKFVDIENCCGEHSVCEKCVILEGRKCQRCRQDFFIDNPPTSEDRSSRHDNLKNWMLNFVGTAGLEDDRDWDYRCLECGQLHVESSVTGAGVFLAPVDSEGNIIECTRFPKVEDGICESCGNHIQVINKHGDDCRFWKAYQQLKEVTGSNESR